MKPSIFDDPKVVEQWCGEQRAHVESYLRQERIEHGPVAQTVAWHAAPYLSVWTVESASKPGKLGWWVACGDMPTDHVSAEYVGTPREALRTFAARWRQLVKAMRRGDPHPELSAGDRAEWPRMAKRLEERADLLTRAADDDATWKE